MILTITLNPSIDYIYHKDHFFLGQHNRFANPESMPGGKGINCSRAIHFLGGDSLTYLVIGGNNGQRILSDLESEDFSLIVYEVTQSSRNAITIMHDDNTHTEIVEAGPIIDDNDEKTIIKDIINKIQNNSSIDTVTINGSVNSKNESFYLNPLKSLRIEFEDRIKIILDISGSQLKNILTQEEFLPDLIKPNFTEFQELVNENFKNKNELLDYLQIYKTNIPYFIVSCGSNGAILKTFNKIYNIEIPKINVVNPTGSGDSTVGGLAFAISNNYSTTDMIKLGMACGISNTMQNGVGVVDKSMIETIKNKIQITEIPQLG